MNDPIILQSAIEMAGAMRKTLADMHAQRQRLAAAEEIIGRVLSTAFHAIECMQWDTGICTCGVAELLNSAAAWLADEAAA